MNLLGIEDYWWWLIGAAALGILEIFLPGIFLAWIAVAAGLTGIIAALLPISLPFQLAIFGLLAIAAVYGGRGLYVRNPVASSDPDLNDRLGRLIGQTVTVIGAIEHGEGRVKVADSIWTARGPDCAVGSRVVIRGTQGGYLLVSPALAIEDLESPSTSNG